MVILKCNDPILTDSLYSLLEQKKITLYRNNQDNCLLIDLIKQNNYLEAIINKKKYKFVLPLDLNIFFSKIVEELFSFSLSFKNISYFPYQRLIINDFEKKTLLSDIQNLILLSLFRKQEGMDKYELYSLIWRNDKDLSMNKLDTHLTNLKNQIQNELKIDFSFHSQNKILKLIIN